jgi:hypothetical protein
MEKAMSAAKKLAVAQEAARLGVCFTMPDEIVLKRREFGMLLDAITDPETVDYAELDTVITEIRSRWEGSCVIYQFRKPETE